MGWYGGHCGACAACREGDFILCENPRIAGLTHDGGYAEHMIASADSLAFIPDSIPLPEAAPLLCAGLTTFNALRNSGARPGDLVAVQGVGGLGHLGIQFARDGIPRGRRLSERRKGRRGSKAWRSQFY
ncbi:MAG: alcohol dehydrogenase catalytic domain-containing protein [Terriglobia bacterium]